MFCGTLILSGELAKQYRLFFGLTFKVEFNNSILNLLVLLPFTPSYLTMYLVIYTGSTQHRITDAICFAPLLHQKTEFMSEHRLLTVSYETAKKHML